MTALIDRLAEASIAYLAAQIDAGAEAVQIFESFGARCRRPCSGRCRSIRSGRIVPRPEGAPAAGQGDRVRARRAGQSCSRLVEAGIADAIALDWTIDLAAALPTLPREVATQGNLDPLALVAGGEALDRGVDAVLAAVRGRPHIFNLGHGIVPETPIEHVERMVARLRAA